MPEPVIVATARSPIGRAFKGSLKELRSDDLAATIVQAALDKVPQLDPHDIDDLMLGCGLPGGEQGYNMGRVVAVLLGYDFIPGTTITRYCSSSLQTTRMAAHAIRAGEGLHRRTGAGGVVLADQRAVWCRDRGDLAGEEAVGDGALGVVLAAAGELVLLLAGQAVQLGDVLRGLPHRDVDVRQRCVGPGVGPGAAPQRQLGGAGPRRRAG